MVTVQWITNPGRSSVYSRRNVSVLLIPTWVLPLPKSDRVACFPLFFLFFSFSGCWNLSLSISRQNDRTLADGKILDTATKYIDHLSGH